MPDALDALAVALREARELLPYLGQEAAPLADGLRELRAEADPQRRREIALDLYSRFVWLRGLSTLLDVRVVRSLSTDPEVRAQIAPLVALVRAPEIRSTLAAMSPARFDSPDVAESPGRVRRFAAALDEPAWAGGPPLRSVWIDPRVAVDGEELTLGDLADWLLLADDGPRRLVISAPPGSGGTSMLRRLGELLLAGGGTPLPVEPDRPVPPEVFASQPRPIFLVDRGQVTPPGPPEGGVRWVILSEWHMGNARLLGVDEDAARRWCLAHLGQTVALPFDRPAALIVLAQAHAEGLGLDTPDYARRLLDRLAARLGGRDPDATRRAWRQYAWTGEAPVGQPWPGRPERSFGDPFLAALQEEHVVATLTPWLDEALDLPQAAFGAAWMSLFGRGRVWQASVLRAARDALHAHHDALQRRLAALEHGGLPAEVRGWGAADASRWHAATVAVAALWPGPLPDELVAALLPPSLGDSVQLDGVVAPVLSVPGAWRADLSGAGGEMFRVTLTDCRVRTEGAAMLRQSRLVGCTIEGDGLEFVAEETTFNRCRVDGQLPGSLWNRACLSACVLAGDFRAATFRLCELNDVDVSGANLADAQIIACISSWPAGRHGPQAFVGLAGPEHTMRVVDMCGADSAEALEAWLFGLDGDYGAGHAFDIEGERFVHAFTPEAANRLLARWRAGRG